MKKLTAKMALEVIEDITAHAGLDRSKYLGTNKEEHDEVIDLIYTIAHVAQRHCGNPHKDWEKQALDLHKKGIGE